MTVESTAERALGPLLPRASAAESVPPPSPFNRATVMVLQVVAALAVLVLSLALVPWLVQGQLSLSQLAGSLTAVLLGLVAIGLLRSGRHRAGVLTLAAAVWAHVAWPMFILGLRHSLMGTRFAVVPLALVSLLLGRRELWGTFAAFAAAAAAGAARDAGWLAGSPLPTLLPSSPLLSTMVLLLLVALLLDRLAGSLREALAEALLGNQALRERDAIMRAVFDVSPGAVSLVRMADLRLIGCNQGFVERLGRSRGELLGSSVADLGLWEDADWELRFLAQAAAEGAVTNVETRLRGKGGRPETALASARALSLRGDLHVLAVANNVSDWKAAQEERERMREQLRQSQKMEAIGRLAGGVAHDFNNILTSILGAASMGGQELPPGHPVRADLDQVQADARRAAELTRQLLAFARKEVVAPKLVDLDERVRGMVRMLQRVLSEGIVLETMLGAGGALAWIDPAQLEQVILNLAVNARDAMPGGGRLRIRTSTHRSGGEGTPASPGPVAEWVRLSVEDEGQGIPPEIVPKIFEPFFTTKGADRGTGLGLATCHGVVAQAGGEIEVDSRPGRGTTFHVLLPRAWGAPEHPAPPDARSRGGSETILVVDDQEAVRRSASRVLRHHRYRVLEAGSVAGAAEVAEQCADPIDLALVDVGLPDGSGRQVADSLRARRPRIRILYTSGHPLDEVVRRGVADASHRYLRKPYAADDLALAVRSTLDDEGGWVGRIQAP